MPLSGARIYMFPGPVDASSRLTMRDKLDLHEVDGSIGRAGFRWVLGRDCVGLSYDFLHLIPEREVRPAWTIVREGVGLRVWRDTHGEDLGRYDTLAQAVAAALGSVTCGVAGTGTVVGRSAARRPPASPVVSPAASGLGIEWDRLSVRRRRDAGVARAEH